MSEETAKKVKPETTIMLDRERTLICDLNAMCEVERITGKSLFQGAYTGSSASDLRVMLWACLVRDDPELKLEDVGALITIDNMVEVAQKLNEVFEAAAPASAAKAKEETENEAPLVQEESTG